MSKQETYISFIKDELRKGNVEYNKVSSVFCSKFQLTDRTFANHWKTANEEYKLESSKVEDAKVQERIENEIQSVRSDILSKQETLEILSKILKNDKEDSRARISAANQMSKMEGWEAPKQIEQKDTTIYVTNKDASSLG